MIEIIGPAGGMDTLISTEAVLVGADDVAGTMIWTEIYVQAQVYPVARNAFMRTTCMRIPGQQC
jgi:hypothetical protein